MSDRYKVVRRVIKEEVTYVRAYTNEEALGFAQDLRKAGKKFDKQPKRVEWEAFYVPPDWQ